MAASTRNECSSIERRLLVAQRREVGPIARAELLQLLVGAPRRAMHDQRLEPDHAAELRGLAYHRREHVEEVLMHALRRVVTIIPAGGHHPQATLPLQRRAAGP